MILPGISALLFAQTAPAGGASALAPFAVQFVLIIAIIYFVLVRPQQRQRKKHETALTALKRGDQVVTAGGIVGEVIHVPSVPKDAPASGRLEDQITIKSGESRLIVERGRIARINGGSSSAPAASSSAAKA